MSCNSCDILFRHMLALIKPRRCTVGMGWVGLGQTTAVAPTQHVFEHLFLQHMRSVNFLIVATPFLHACQQHVLGH